MSYYIITDFDIRTITAQTYAAGIVEATRIQQPSTDLITQREAWRRYGTRNIKRWQDAGLLKGKRTGPSTNNSVKFSVSEIALAMVGDKIKTACAPVPESLLKKIGTH